MSQSLTFWQNIPSIHQAPLIRAVARRWPGTVRVVTEKDVSEHRLAQGWERPDFGKAELILSPNREVRCALIDDGTSKDDVHLFSGFNAYPETYWTLMRLARSDAVLGVMVEPGRHTDGFKTHLRRLKHRALAWRWRKRLALVLATGDLGCVWWQSAGFPADKVAPFGYFVAPLDKDLLSAPGLGSKARVFRMLYVGQLIQRKAPDVLFRALAMLDAKGWVLDIIGNGPEEALYKRFTEKTELFGSVYWRGTMPNAQVLSYMAQADLFILPCRFDGWGAVVNEALTVGTSVLASDACGASCLLAVDRLGKVFPSEDSAVLSRALQERLDCGCLTHEQRAQIREWASRAIAPEAAADYLLDILQRARMRRPFSELSPPWVTALQSNIGLLEKTTLR